MTLDGRSDDGLRHLVQESLGVLRVSAVHRRFSAPSGGNPEKVVEKNFEAPISAFPPRRGMWSVKQGRLFCGTDAVGVRRVVVELVAGRSEGPVAADKARTMIRMERALSLRDLSKQISRESP